ncbi:ABC transporter substrate-binding protein [Roseivivax halodurans JCM 10272]|uniref:ABC transporter substrate-binding protein n=2 Tax=Roseivivax halodurans TaxID=93683 RepID=X7EJZ8_9RHOB|nr:iron ABC transporter substrate-binding protein [Roseivivax halodurans]ETX16389.1 ABC transporter substrate-binding protein [Roseivivax halodurans JCM 10272]
MRSLLAFVLLASPAAARTITDSAGRIVDIPDEIETVFAAGPPASVLVYVIAPETLTGWPRALRPEERDYIAEPYRDLPETGRLTGRGGEANLERVLEIAPDLILDFGSVRDTYVDLANRVQEQMDIPYVLIDGRFENTPDALRLLGEVLGKPERGERLARDAEETFARIDTILAEIPEEDRPRTYLARGPDGLETGMTGSINTEIIERAGGVNVADDGGRTQGLVQVSPEQVIVSDPEIVVTWDPTFYGRVWSDPLWAGVDAVRSGQVFLSPTAPFGWIDRPPSLNRMMGLRWMARLFYPDRWEGDLREETAEFYKTWYRVDLGDAELDRLLEWAEGRPPE